VFKDVKRKNKSIKGERESLLKVILEDKGINE
jgi:hypothetical protein